MQLLPYSAASSVCITLFCSQDSSRKAKHDLGLGRGQSLYVSQLAVHRFGSGAQGVYGICGGTQLLLQFRYHLAMFRKFCAYSAKTFHTSLDCFWMASERKPI